MISHTPLTGRGLFVRDPADQGKLLLCEPPLVTVDDQPSKSLLSVQTSWRIVEALLRDARTRQKYMTSQLTVEGEVPRDPQYKQHLRLLHIAYRYPIQELANLYASVVRYNLGYRGSDGVVRYQIYPRVAMSNHSCNPSARLEQRAGRRLVANLYALRPLVPGEEVTWCYFDDPHFLDEPWQIRMAHLLALHGFVCRCPRCGRELPNELQDVDDAVWRQLLPEYM